MKIDKPLFSVHEYISNGAITTKGIFLHFDNTRILVANDIQEFEDLLKHFQIILSELKVTL